MTSWCRASQDQDPPCGEIAQGGEGLHRQTPFQVGPLVPRGSKYRGGGVVGAGSEKAQILIFLGILFASVYLINSHTLSLSIFIFVIVPSVVFDFVSSPNHQHARCQKNCACNGTTSKQML